MKAIRNICLSIVSFAALLGSQASANNNFEIYNKAPYTIYIAGINIAGITNNFSQKTAVEPNKVWATTIDPNKAIKLMIYTKPTDLPPIGVFRVDAPGKTKYVTWNPTKDPALYPQTGPWYGFFRKTQSGLPLKNNLHWLNIQRIPNR